MNVETKAKHDLIFFSNRSTPKVVSQGMKFDAPESYGKVTRRRAATAEEERRIAKGEWVRVDSSGKKPKDAGYRQSNLRPQFNDNKKKKKQKKSDEVDVETKGRLDWSPGKNWVEQEGGLPKYIEDIALALIRDHGFTREHAIATAVNRVKKWASGVGNVNADTRAKAAAAWAQWEKLKAKAKLRKNKS